VRIYAYLTLLLVVPVTGITAIEQKPEEKESVVNKEVEVKAKIDKQTFEKVCSWLKTNATCKGSCKQIDYYLNNPKFPFFFTSPKGYKEAYDYLRVRCEGEKQQLCFKRLHEDPKTKKPLYCDEWEVEVSDHAKTLEIMQQLGYTEKTLLEKTRKTYRYNEFEIALDKVTGLGAFVEVELKEPVADSKAGLQKIFSFLNEMGVTSFQLQKRGYLSMLWNPGYDFGETVEL